MLWTLDHLLLVTGAAVLIALALVLLIHLALHQHYPHEETRAAIGAGFVTILVAVLFSVALNNLYAMKRDRDSRLRNLRDQHYAQLKPILHSESLKLAEAAEQIRKEAHITRVNRYENAAGVCDAPFTAE